MRHILLALTIALAAPAAAHAGSFTLGEDAGAVTIDIPDDWSPKEYEGGVEATSPNDTYVFVEATEMSDLAGTVQEGIEYLQKQGLTFDAATEKNVEGVKVNGMATVIKEWAGKDENGDASISLVAIVVDDKNAVLLMTWSDPESEKKDQDTFMGVVNSIKKAE